jgi:exopolysaccharide biosynthesis polyprenyl glycosylphosphotransferase
MPDDKDNVDYWISTGTRTGRFRERMRVSFKLAVWKGVILAAYGLKRVLDITAATAALVLGSPVFALTALLIKLEDGGPIFFQQTRVGYRGSHFGMWKFRSMVTNAEEIKKKLEAQNEMQGGVIFKMKNDPRVTRVGRIIRKYSIDELPQFWNVLVGDMSLVGPRPSLPREVAEYRPEQRQRLMAKPGITCLWQVSGRSEIDFHGQVRLDLDYIRSTSLWTDIKLLARTVPAVLMGKGAY